MKAYKQISISITVLGLLAVILNACSTKKNTFTRRAYHNLTAHYNAYFNGNESMKEGVATLTKAHKDDYSKILPVFKYGTVADATAINPQMERAYKKASIVIQRHSINIGGVEYCKWIDDSYLMIGKSHFYKRDYRLAIETFDYIQRTYNTPLKYEAQLWMAKAYNQLEKYDKSQIVLDDLKKKMAKASSSKNVVREYPLVVADLALRQNDVNTAIEFLNKALKEKQKKQTKIRVNFILAQLYEQKNQLKKATQAYNNVLRLNPPYEVAFNAKINLANCFDARSQDSRFIKKQLNKMLKDVKNKEFQDQIYYALAEVAFKEKDSTLAINYLKKSAALSIVNDNQKARSFLKLANIYFNRQDYVPSQQYYDSTITYLSKDYPNYSSILSRKEKLGELVKHILIVQLEDSLQRIGKMSVSERNSLVDGIIANLIKEEQKQKQEEAERQQALMLLAQNTEQKNQTASTSSWYFYNPTAITFGYTEFAKKFGNRKLEDNWRISNKQVVSLEIADDGSDSKNTKKEGDTTKTQTVNLKDRNYYLKNIPTTNEQIKESNKRIEEALYQLGHIYRDDFSNIPKSNASFEALIARFPETAYLLRTYYYLYRNYTEIKNTTKANYYKNLILTNYPESDFAKIIQNPDYLKELATKKSAVEIFYQKVYDAFKAETYDQVIKMANEADTMFPNNAMIPKFQLIKAISIGKSKTKPEFEAALTDLIKKYPTSKEKETAQALLDVIQGKISATSSTTTSASSNGTASVVNASPFKYNENDIHLYVMLINIRKLNLKDIKVAIADYNTAYFDSQKLTISNYYLDDKRQVITVANFPEKQKAMSYLSGITNYDPVTSKTNDVDFKHFIISVDNYTIFYKNKNVEEYLTFYNKYYTK